MASNRHQHDRIRKEFREISALIDAKRGKVNAEYIKHKREEASYYVFSLLSCFIRIPKRYNSTHAVRKYAERITHGQKSKEVKS